MIKKEIKSIILHLDSATAIDYLTDEQAGILIKAVFRYGRNGQMLESSDTALTALFTMLCTQIDRDHRKYEERCERNVANAKKRYEKLHPDEQQPPIACDGMQSHPNACHNDNNSDNDNKTDNDDDNADALIISGKYPTIEDFFKVFNPKRQLYICQYPAYCITEPSPTLTQIDIMYGPFASAKWLVPLIADVSLCCGLKEDASEDQLQLTATAILERYKWLKAGELMLFFFNFKAGFYERFYSYFDPQAIIRSMKLFLQERNLAIDAYERDLSTYKGVLQ
ncbi:MAG: hypothetical protein IKM76_08625 [Prevotella sp.]|nr:hypothetical protein [Prevotella sp.]